MFALAEQAVLQGTHGLQLRMDDGHKPLALALGDRRARGFLTDLAPQADHLGDVGELFLHQRRELGEVVLL